MPQRGKLGLQISITVPNIEDIVKAEWDVFKQPGEPLPGCKQTAKYR